MSEPIPIRVTRYKCPHCARSHSKKAACVGHIGRCWHNPENQSCATCAHWQAPGDGEQCIPGDNCSCNRYPQACGAGEDLAPEERPRLRCPKWEAIW